MPFSNKADANKQGSHSISYGRDRRNFLASLPDTHPVTALLHKLPWLGCLEPVAQLFFQLEYMYGDRIAAATKQERAQIPDATDMREALRYLKFQLPTDSIASGETRNAFRTYQRALRAIRDISKNVPHLQENSLKHFGETVTTLVVLIRHAR